MWPSVLSAWPSGAKLMHAEPLLARVGFSESPGTTATQMPWEMSLKPWPSHSVPQGLPKVTVWEDSLQSRCSQNPCQGN